MTYTILPNSGQTLGASRPFINTNFSLIQSVFDVNHVDFNATGAGKHKFVQIPVGSPTNVAGEGTLYTVTLGGETQLAYLTDGQGKAYQLTRTISGSFTTFGQSIAYGTPPADFTQVGGWSFLPGGLLIQYGFFSKAGATGTSGLIQFPVTWSTGNFTIQMTLYRNSGNQSISLDSSNPPTTTNFHFLTSSAGSDGIEWMAIGK